MVIGTLIVTEEEEVEVSTSEGVELNYKFSKGFWYISEIVSHPDTEIPTVTLATDKGSFINQDKQGQIFDFSELSNMRSEGSGIVREETGVELCDRKGVRECQRELNRLNDKIAALINSEYADPALLQRLEREKEFLLQYLKEVYNPYLKRIRLTRTEADRICHAVDMAVRRSIGLIEKDNRFIAATLQARISINRYAVYRSESDLNIEIIAVKRRRGVKQVVKL